MYEYAKAAYATLSENERVYSSDRSVTSNFTFST